MTIKERKVIGGMRLSELLRDCGLKQNDITKEKRKDSPLDPPQVSKICTGKRLMNEEQAKWLIKEFFPLVTVQYLLVDDGIQTENVLKEDEKPRSKTIEELKAEKKRIEEQIRVLKSNALVFKRAKFGLDPYVQKLDPADEDTWSLSLKTYSHRNEHWHSIIRLTNKQDVIDAIPEFIADLTGIYKMLTGIDKEEK